MWYEHTARTSPHLNYGYADPRKSRPAQILTRGFDEMTVAYLSYVTHNMERVSIPFESNINSRYEVYRKVGVDSSAMNLKTDPRTYRMCS